MDNFDKKEKEWDAFLNTGNIKHYLEYKRLSRQDKQRQIEEIGLIDDDDIYDK